MRTFDTNIKNILIQLEQQQQHQQHPAHSTNEATFVASSFDELVDTQQSGDENVNDSLSTLSATNLPSNSVPLDNKPSEKRINRQDKQPSEFIDENDRVRPYVDFDELDKLLALDENKAEINGFIRQLEELAVVVGPTILEESENIKI